VSLKNFPWLPLITVLRSYSIQLEVLNDNWLYHMKANQSLHNHFGRHGAWGQCSKNQDSQLLYIFIPVTRTAKGYTRFVRKYVTGRRKRFQPHKVYIFLIRIRSRVDLARSVCLSVRMNAETIRARLLGLGMQIPELLTQRKFVFSSVPAPSNAHKPLWDLQFWC